MRRRRLLEGGIWAAASALLPGSGRAGDELLAHLSRPQDLGTPLRYHERLITPSPVFFVRSHFGPPALNRSRPLRVAGQRPLDLDAEGLRAFPEVTAVAVLQCAGNGRALHAPRVPGVQWVHGALGQASWTGVRLRDLLEHAGIPDGSAHVQLEGADLPPKPTVPRFIRSIPMEQALDPGTLVAYRMNGELLSLAHGAPFRLVVPGWAGEHWVKWLVRVTPQPAEAEGFYQKTAYRFPKQPVAPGATVPPDQMAPLTRLPVKSLIARPGDGDRVPPGNVEVAGVAFSGSAAIDRVEVSVDGGHRWQSAALEGEAGAGRWQVFRARFVASRAGCYRAVARAFDRAGASQPETAVWNPSGYLWNAWHQVEFTVRG